MKSLVSSSNAGKQRTAITLAKSQRQSSHCADSNQLPLDKTATDLDPAGQHPQPPPVAREPTFTAPMQPIMSAPPDATISVAKPVLSASKHTHRTSPAASVDRPETPPAIWERFDEHWAQQVQDGSLSLPVLGTLHVLCVWQSQGCAFLV